MKERPSDKSDQDLNPTGPISHFTQNDLEIETYS